MSENDKAKLEELLAVERAAHKAEIATVNFAHSADMAEQINNAHTRLQVAQSALDAQQEVLDKVTAERDAAETVLEIIFEKLECNSLSGAIAALDKLLPEKSSS